MVWFTTPNCLGTERKAADVAKEGDEVTVLVKSIDRENKRVALSIKATLEDPWKVEASQFHIGDILDVEVVRLLAFGAYR